LTPKHWKTTEITDPEAQPNDRLVNVIECRIFEIRLNQKTHEYYAKGS